MQREQTLAAAQLAGLEVTRLINEPTAAALAYGLQDKDAESTFVVLDLGGGTFDVSILEMFDGVMEVRASSGDAFLGGEDFTRVISLHLAKELGHDFSKLKQDQKEKVYFAAEQMKVALSEQQDAQVTLQIAKKAQEVSLSRSKFDELCLGLLSRMRKPIVRCLNDAKIEIGEVDRVLLVGGSTRIPAVRSMASRLFQKLPERSIDPDLVVAMGAAVQAGLCQKNQALEDVVMTDVAPFSLGIMSQNTTMHGTIHGAFIPIIERNTTIPTSRSQYFSTTADNQTRIDVEIYQGESPLAKDNMKLGGLMINVRKANAGEESIEVRFSYDVNGLLDVDVTAVSTQISKNIVIDGGSKALSVADRKASLKRLSTLKMHPREKSENQNVTEALNELFTMLLGDDRQEVQGLIAQFESALATQAL